MGNMPRVPITRENAHGAGKFAFGVETHVRTTGCQWFAKRGVVILLFLVPIAITAVLLAPTGAASPQSALSSQGTQTTRTTRAQEADVQRALSTSPGEEVEAGSGHRPNQKQSILNANFAKAKSDAAELAVLAKELREALSKPDVDDHSLDVANRADKIGKLAKKIREETKAY